MCVCVRVSPLFLLSPPCTSPLSLPIPSTSPSLPSPHPPHPLNLPFPPIPSPSPPLPFPHPPIPSPSSPLPSLISECNLTCHKKCMESVVLECNSQALEELSRRMSMTETPPPLKVCLFVTRRLVSIHCSVRRVVRGWNGVEGSRVFPSTVKSA